MPWSNTCIDILILHELGCNTRRHVEQEHTLLYYATQSVVRTLTSPFLYFEATTEQNI